MSRRLLYSFFLLALVVPASSNAQKSSFPGSPSGARAPHPAPQAPRAAALTQESCETCHSSISREWRASRHKNAATNPEFQAALDREEPRLRSFCLGCHAPERKTSSAGPLSDSEKKAHDQGVSCLTCHVTGHSGVISGKAPSEKRASRAPHSTTYAPNYGSSRTCQSCHEFPFPDPRLERSDPRFAFMQRTWSEHHDDAFSSKTCVDCHMPPVKERKSGAGRSHGFPGGYDEALLRRALEIGGSFPGPHTYRVTLTPKDVTHAVPTGDLFRRLRVTIELYAGDRLETTCEKFLSRHYARNRRNKRIEVSDDRVHLQASHVDCQAVSPKTTVAKYRVEYERVSHLPKDDEKRAVLESSVRLAAGESQREIH